MRAIAIAIALAASACASASRGGPDSVASPDAAGERLYRRHCAACHRLRDPAEHPAARWAWAVEKFGPRAHLSEEERRLVLAYLQARAQDAAPPGRAR